MAKQPSSREAEEEAIRKAKGKAIERKQKRRDNKKKPKEEAIETLDSSSIVNPGTKRTASTHEPPDHPQKPRKRAREKTPSPHVDKRAEDVGTQLHQARPRDPGLGCTACWEHWLKEAMRTRGPKSLMRIIRDAMIVYYEAYKRPESGFIHGDISIENILVPTEGSVLTGGLTHEDRSGTLIDWNLCFNARGESSNRVFRSGTPAFMAPVLLQDKPIPRRTLAHDMESFFTVIIWIATLDYFDEVAFQAKPLATVMLDQGKAPIDIVNAKGNWFKRPGDFKETITDYFQQPYREDLRFLKCLFKLREILYPDGKFDLDALLYDGLDKNDNKVTEDADQMKEGLFRQCMKEIDDYLGDTKGCYEMDQIGRWRAAEGTDGRATKGTDGRGA